jgi:hypothetical protein
MNSGKKHQGVVKISKSWMRNRFYLYCLKVFPNKTITSYKRENSKFTADIPEDKSWSELTSPAMLSDRLSEMSSVLHDMVFCLKCIICV